MTATHAEPADFLTGFILSLLTPFLMTGSITDPDIARRAAAEAVAAYKAAAHDQLLTVTQIVAFALGSVGALRLSLPPDLPLPMKLKLFGSANALNRCSQQAIATLETQRRTIPEPDPEPDQAQTLARTLARLEATKTLIRQAPQDQQDDVLWAGAMIDVATEFTAELPDLPPAERCTHLARIAALTEIARQLATGTAPPLQDRLKGFPVLRT